MNLSIENFLKSRKIFD